MAKPAAPSIGPAVFKGAAAPVADAAAEEAAPDALEACCTHVSRQQEIVDVVRYLQRSKLRHWHSQ